MVAPGPARRRKAHLALIGLALLAGCATPGDAALPRFGDGLPTVEADIAQRNALWTGVIRDARRCDLPQPDLEAIGAVWGAEIAATIGARNRDRYPGASAAVANSVMDLVLDDSPPPGAGRCRAIHAWLPQVRAAAGR